MEPQTAIPPPPPHPRQIKDEAAQMPKHAIFPSLPRERGEGGVQIFYLFFPRLYTALTQKKEKASLVSRVSRFTEEKGK